MKLSGLKRREIENERKMVNRLWDKPTTWKFVAHHLALGEQNRKRAEKTVNKTIRILKRIKNTTTTRNFNNEKRNR